MDVADHDGVELHHSAGRDPYLTPCPIDSSLAMASGIPVEILARELISAQFTPPPDSGPEFTDISERAREPRRTYF